MNDFETHRIGDSSEPIENPSILSPEAAAQEAPRKSLSGHGEGSPCRIAGGYFYRSCNDEVEEVITTSEKPMTKEAAARIQSAAAINGADPAFAVRAQAAADRHVVEAKKSK